MPAEIIKVYKENLPKLRFIGKCYTNADRVNGSYGSKWGEWFEKGWFAELEKLGEAKDIENGYLGFMRCNGHDAENSFEYWIGIFFPENTAVPDGFLHIDLDESSVAVCFIKGREDDGLYGMHDACIAKFCEHCMGNFYSDSENRAYFFERYNCPRFTGPDEDGNVILDYGIYLDNKTVDSRCGLHCTNCDYKQSHNCGGCIETNGNPFHGECPVAKCCGDKGFTHCGECANIPCELLTQYSCDPEHGDTPAGARIEQCKKWAKNSK